MGSKKSSGQGGHRCLRNCNALPWQHAFLFAVPIMLLLSGCQVALRPVGDAVDQSIAEHKRYTTARNAFLKKFHPVGYVPPTPISGRRDLPGGHLNVWRIPRFAGWAEPSIPLSDSALIVVNFNKADPKVGASYHAIVRTDCATLELWILEWSTFASEYGLGSVIDQGNVSPSRQLLPGNEMTKKAAQWICDSVLGTQ